MSSASELNTTTETRTNIESEEITLYECPSCEQQVEEDELVPIEIGEGKWKLETVTCEYCARSDYGYQGNPTVDDVVEQLGVGLSVVSHVLSPLFLMLGLLLYLVGAVWLAGALLVDVELAIAAIRGFPPLAVTITVIGILLSMTAGWFRE